ncbi:MAG TPA: LuxR C-terminal-related transcriptional regulator [Mycobacterium sp.]|nr:LuxR C-terminal-related transcriptional regulator [Mycobacterium sp.]
MERAVQLGGDMPLFIALTLRATLGAYAGPVEQTRLDAGAAVAAGRRCSAHTLTEGPITALGFLELSLGDHRSALKTLHTQVGRLDAAPDGTEIIAASFVPDVVEAMIHLKHFADAEPLIARLERNGRRLDRPWMLAVGARCRAMLLAARGDHHAASTAVEQAMNEHRRLPMPFELARTQLLLGQLQRRHGHQQTAAATLREACATFADLNTPLWAERAHRELSANNSEAHRTAVLTPGEERVTELASTGLTNRRVAETLFISPKTVEANLVRIYHKLGIHSRAELGRRMSQSEGWTNT